MTIFTPQYIQALVPRHPDPATAAVKLEAARIKYGIATPRQAAMYAAQGAHESGLQPIEENLNYSIATMMRVWPGRFPTVASAVPFARNPQALANRVYGGRGGNNNPGDGWLYHGRGIVQLTFHDNYALYQSLTGFGLLQNPALLLQYGVSAQVYGAFWQHHSLNAAADRGDVVAVTRAINGGVIGLDERECLYQRACKISTTRLGLLADPAQIPASTEVDVEADAQADLDARHELFTQALSLLAS